MRSKIRTHTFSSYLTDSGEILQMVITISIDVVEHYEFKKTFHVNHPCWDSLSDAFEKKNAYRQEY